MVSIDGMDDRRRFSANRQRICEGRGPVLESGRTIAARFARSAIPSADAPRLDRRSYVRIGVSSLACQPE